MTLFLNKANSLKGLAALCTLLLVASCFAIFI